MAIRHVHPEVRADHHRDGERGLGAAVEGNDHNEQEQNASHDRYGRRERVETLGHGEGHTCDGRA